MSSLIQDLRFGARLLVRDRAFTAVAAIVLALGIGANTAVFSLMNSLVLKPRVGAADHELAGVYSRDRTQPGSYRAFSYPNYADLRSRNLFASLTAHNFALVGLSEGGSTRRVFVDIATGNFFATFGVPLALGRTFTPDEERPGADIPVTVISYGAWQKLGGTADVLGRTMRLNAREFTIVGVAPKGFGGSMVLVTPELWLPTGVYDSISNDFMRDGLPATLADRRHHNLILVARLHPGSTIASVTPAVEAAGAQLEQAFPGENKNQALQLAPLARLSVSTSPQTDSQLGVLGVLLFSMSGLVLMVASLNLANMLLARATARRKEFAIRLAIGGSRARIVRQLLSESLVLSIAGGALGVMVAWWGTRFLGSSLAPLLPLVIHLDTTPDVRVLAATLGFCVVSTVLFGLGPAWRLARTDAVPELKDQAGEMLARRRSRFMMRNMLVTGQLALSLVTLTAAGLFVRTALESAVADPGFTFDRGILVNVDPSLASRTPVATRAYYEQALLRLRRMPGVEHASFGSFMPFGEFTETREVQKAGAPIRPDDPQAATRLVDSVTTTIGADYFKTLGLPVLRGREFSAVEEISPDAPAVAIIDQTLSNRLFGSENPIGQSVQYSVRGSTDIVVLQVVGVVAPTRHQLLERDMPAHIYTPYGRDYRSGMFLHVRTSAPTAEAEERMLPEVRAQLTAIDPTVPVLTLETRAMFRERNLVLWTIRAGANMFLTFGGIALFMSVVGVYGVKSYVVARRTREFGIRLALGAGYRDIIGMVLRDGVVLTAVGLAAGIALSAAASALISGLLAGERGLDVTVLVAASLVLAAAALGAGWIPARRATRIAPTIALRRE